MAARVYQLLRDRKTIGEIVCETELAPAEVRAIFDRSQAIDDFKLSGKDLDVKKDGDKVVVSYSYEREIPLFGPAVLLMRYKGQSR